MKLIKLGNDRFRLIEDNVKIEGSLDLIEERLLQQGLTSLDELDEALLSMAARGTSVAHFGMSIKQAFGGNKAYSFMYSIEEVA